MCYAGEPKKLAATLKKMGKPIPTIRILLMTHTSELGQNSDGKEYASFEATGQCKDARLAATLKTTPEIIENALLGQDAAGDPVVPTTRINEYFSTVVGIDTAGPETTCFTASGMNYYTRLVEAVYTAAKKRRGLGWQGKLLVHTHVGEGSTVYYGKQFPVKPWTFKEVFGRLPDESGNEVTNANVAHKNISTLLAAIANIERAHQDIHDYVVFRLGHVTWADQAQAEAMADAQVEADVNLDSNIATNAYPLSYMPNRNQIKVRLSRILSDPVTNLEVNDFPHFLIPDPQDVNTVGEVLGNASLKYLLLARVRVLLGSDGSGVEHASMSREYALAASLIKYWDGHAADFRERTGDISEHYFFDNVNWHLKNMSTDTYMPYR